MGRALFDHADFLSTARTLAAERGPAAVTVDSVIAQLKAPKGSFYYRFASRDLLMGELWLTTVLAYQQGFVAAIEAGDGLAAALHTPAWVRRHLVDARLKRGVRDQAERFEGCLTSFARQTFGRAGPAELRRATFVLAEVPIAAVRQHLERREPPPPLVDEMIAATYRALCGPRTSLPGRAPVASPSR